MKYKWLNKNNNNKIIIFFNGWGMDEVVVNHLQTEDFDVVMFYDYTNLGTDFDFDNLNSYQNSYLVSWSMGVMIGTKFNHNIHNLISSTAINGTLKPIDALYGIHPKIYNLTIKGFNEFGRDKFISNMQTPIPNYKGRNSSIEELQAELISIKEYSAEDNFKYSKVFISNNDKIIPTKNQISYWGIEPNLNSGHSPFHLFQKWSELL
jgi:biotin synthesis protein BioG